MKSFLRALLVTLGLYCGAAFGQVSQESVNVTNFIPTGICNFAPLTKVSNVGTYQCVNSIWTLVGPSAGGGAPTGAAGGDLGGTYPNPTVVASHIISGGAAFTGNVSTTGNITTNGNFIATGPNTAPVNVTTQNSVQIFTGNASTQPSVAYVNSGATLNNRIAYMANSGAGLAFGFANDTFSTGIQPLVISGGFASGITGIASNSGSGSWVHTGTFNATAFVGSGVNITNLSATNLASGTIPAARLPATIASNTTGNAGTATTATTATTANALVAVSPCTGPGQFTTGISSTGVSQGCAVPTPPTLTSLGHFHGTIALGASAATSTGVIVSGFVPTASASCVFTGQNAGGVAALNLVSNMVMANGSVTLTYSTATGAGGNLAWMCDN